MPQIITPSGAMTGTSDTIDSTTSEGSSSAVGALPVDIAPADTASADDAGESEGSAPAEAAPVSTASSKKSSVELTPHISLGMDMWRPENSKEKSYKQLREKLGVTALFRGAGRVNPYVSGRLVLGQVSKTLAQATADGNKKAAFNSTGFEGEAGVQWDVTKDGSVTLPLGVYVGLGKARGQLPFSSVDMMDDVKGYQEAGVSTGININSKTLQIGFGLTYGARTYASHTPGYAEHSRSANVVRPLGFGFSIGWTPGRKKVVNDLHVITPDKPTIEKADFNNGHPPTEAGGPLVFKAGDPLKLDVTLPNENHVGFSTITVQVGEKTYDVSMPDNIQNGDWSQVPETVTVVENISQDFPEGYTGPVKITKIDDTDVDQAVGEGDIQIEKASGDTVEPTPTPTPVDTPPGPGPAPGASLAEELKTASVVSAEDGVFDTEPLSLKVTTTKVGKCTVEINGKKTDIDIGAGTDQEIPVLSSSDYAGYDNFTGKVKIVAVDGTALSAPIELLQEVKIKKPAEVVVVDKDKILSSSKVSLNTAGDMILTVSSNAATTLKLDINGKAKSVSIKKGDNKTVTLYKKAELDAMAKPEAEVVLKAKLTKVDVNAISPAKDIGEVKIAKKTVEPPPVPPTPPDVNVKPASQHPKYNKATSLPMPTFKKVVDGKLEEIGTVDFFSGFDLDFKRKMVGYVAIKDVDAAAKVFSGENAALFQKLPPGCFSATYKDGVLRYSLKDTGITVKYAVKGKITKLSNGGVKISWTNVKGEDNDFEENVGYWLLEPDTSSGNFNPPIYKITASFHTVASVPPAVGPITKEHSTAATAQTFNNAIQVVSAL